MPRKPRAIDMADLERRYFANEPWEVIEKAVGLSRKFCRQRLIAAGIIGESDARTIWDIRAPNKGKELSLEQLAPRYLAYEPWENLERDFGLERQMLRRRLADAGIVREARKPWMDKVDAATVATGFAAGLSVKELASIHGIQRSTVARVLAKQGIEVRSRSGAMLLRMKKASPQQRQDWARAAHAAVRGSVRPHEVKVLYAQAVEKAGDKVAWPDERKLRAMLGARGLACIPQQAIGPYNCDLGCAPVAVEVYSGNWHVSGPKAERIVRRTRYILNAGWHVLMLHLPRNRPISTDAADYIVSYVQSARSHPAAGREYRVIRCTAEMVVSGSLEADHITLKPAARNAQHPSSHHGGVSR